MRASWYEQVGDPHRVLRHGEQPDPEPQPGEVRIRLAASGVNPGDVKKRDDTFASGMSYPLVIPHSDGAGTVDRLGEGVAADWAGQRVWCHGAQSYRPFGTAAEFTCVPVAHAVRLPAAVSFEQGALLGIPGITAHEAVHAGGPVADRTVLVQGAAGAVGSIAVTLARRAGARVLATVRRAADVAVAQHAGAHHVVRAGAAAVDEILALAPDGVDHIVEVAFGAHIAMDEAVLRLGGSISIYGTDAPTPAIPVWPLVFKNVRLYFLGSDDFPEPRKQLAAAELTAAAAAGWLGLPVVARHDLSQVADAHVRVAAGARGRVLVLIAAAAAGR